MFSFSSTTLGIKRAAIHIGITDAKGSSESLILLLILVCQLVSLSYPRGEEVKGLKEINNKMQSHIHTIAGMDLTATRKGRQERETVHSKKNSKHRSESGENAQENTHAGLCPGFSSFPPGFTSFSSNMSRKVATFS